MSDLRRAALNSLFFLGENAESGYPILYPENPADRPHLAYYGTTRSGKTYGVEYALQQLAIQRNAGFCYVDPHGSSYWRMASFLRQHRITDRVLFWDINDPDFIVTYDPFDHPGARSFIAGNLTTAVLATLGREADAREQPHLKTITEAGFHALLELGLPFPFAREFFDPAETEVKEIVASRLSRSNLVAQIASMRSFRDRYQELAAPYRRINNLFLDDRLRLTFTSGGVDFQQLMDEGWIILVNTEQRDQADEAAVLFTRLLVKQFFMAAKRRSTDEPFPFFLAIDEASRYLTTDSAQILSQTAKFGLYLLLGMQSIDQARLENEETYVAIRKNVNAEVVLRLSDFEEKQYFARRFFSDKYEFTKRKHEQVRTVAIPRSVQHITRSLSTPSGATTSYSEFGESGYLSYTETSTPSTETETDGYHTEYDYEEERIPTFFSVEELELQAMRAFSARGAGRSRRFGVVRVNDGDPETIEIPLLAPAVYSQQEMETWLHRFKLSQPATLRRADAERQYQDLIEAHRGSLELVEPAVDDVVVEKAPTVRISKRPKVRF